MTTPLAGAVALPGVAYAEVNWGRWLARCPRPWCTNALCVTRGQLLFRCEGLDACGMVADLTWPADPDAVEALLAHRPVSRTRNWLPGETLTDLVAENAAHGVLPAAWGELADAAGGQLDVATIAGGRVVGGLLFHEIAAADARRQIGA
jgi:hypothetical protein